MALKRTTHWATKELSAFFQTRANQPFAWGTNDCALFAADGILAMTGSDLAADFRGKYQDEASAFALVRTLTGGSSVADAAAWCAQKAGLVELQRPLMAQRGDLVIVKNADATGDDAAIAGLMHLSGRHAISVGPAGLLRIPVVNGDGTSNILRAWRV